MASSPSFKLSDACKFAAAHGLKAEAEKIMSMKSDPRIRGKFHGPRKGCLVELFEGHGLMDEFVAQYWPARHTALGEQRRQSYLDKKALNERLLRGEAPEDEDEIDETSSNSLGDDSADPDPVAFALEAHLREFIVANLPQLRVGGTDGVEYPTDVGPMGWVKVRLAEQKDVRGVVVARSIDEKLRYAACVIPNVVLLEYEVDFKLRDVESVVGGLGVSALNTTEKSSAPA